MAYYPDLSPCPYFGQAEADKLVAIGWLDEAYPYAQGELSAPFLDALFELLAEPWAPMYLLGYADCPWCGNNYDATYNGRSPAIGALNMFVPGEGFLYVMPSLAAHYMLSHGYAPPQEFCDAVLRCPPMSTKAYFEAIAASAPEKYAAVARKRLDEGVNGN